MLKKLLNIDFQCKMGHQSLELTISVSYRTQKNVTVTVDKLTKVGIILAIMTVFAGDFNLFAL